MGPTGKVIGIDHIKELVDDSVNNLTKDDPSLISSGRVRLMGKRLQARKGPDLSTVIGETPWLK